MKRKWTHPEAPDTGRQYWRSLGELEDSKDFKSWLEREFPQGAAELEADGESRRNFIKLMGAATALAGFGTACSRPVRSLVPFNDHVEWLVPGKALYYASVKQRLGGRGCDPLMVTTYDGRPTKVDGNRLHPAVSGGTDAFTQASILDLYDPNRSRGFLRGGAPTVAADFKNGFLDGFRKSASGAGVGFLVSESSSPTRERLLNEVVAKFSGAKVYSYEMLAGDGRREAEETVYGEGARAVPNFEKAERILSLDCDFLGLDKQGEDPVAEFSRGRSVDADGAQMNRLYTVEPGFTLTGGMADHRYRLAAGQVLQVASLFAEAITGVSVPGVNKAVYNNKWISECAKDLLANKGKALVVAGSNQPKAVHQLAAAMNAALTAPVSVVNTGAKSRPGLAQLVADINSGNVETLFVMTEADPVFDAPGDLNVASAFEKLSHLVHHGVRQNLTSKQASWHVPGAHYLEAWGDARTELGVYSVAQPMIRPMWGGLSEVNFLSSLLVPAPHETDQDVAAPEAEGEPVEVVTSSELDAVGDGLAAVKATFNEVAAGADWNEVVRVGFAKGTSFPAASAGNAVAPTEVELMDMPHPEALEVNLVPSSATYDGRFANNGWMQEAPDPITKLTWDNAALIGVATAKKLGIKEDGEMILITVGDREIRVPVLRVPGQADYTLQIPVGYYGDILGVDDEPVDVGNVATGVGFSVNGLRTTVTPFTIPGATVKRLGYEHELARTAEHYSMEGRALVREGTKEMFDEHADFAKDDGMDAHIPPETTLYQGYDFTSTDKFNPDRNEENQKWALEGHEFRVDPDHQWAMTIDLHSCIGCNACTVACQAENNIPIVGKGQVIAGREMHWIRMDRYFTSPKDHEIISERGGVGAYVADAFGGKELEIPGQRTVDDDAVEMVSQPVACQQCEAAPCETVCPVNATVHSSDGLNAMTYNRCIGTRYCANNCPYKARRFNYFDYNKRPLDKLYHGPLAPAEGRATTTEQLQKNPNVTVRMRGVIEKCTYCVQRISKAKIAAKVEARDSNDVQVPANSVTTACQTACPAGAINFGNLMHKDDSINTSKENPRNYDLLSYIGVRPRTSYLARVKNPNPAMPGADKVGVITSKMH